MSYHNGKYMIKYQIMMVSMIKYYIVMVSRIKYHITMVSVIKYNSIVAQYMNKYHIRALRPV